MKTCNLFLTDGLFDWTHDFIMKNKKKFDTFVVLSNEAKPNIPWDKIKYNLVVSGMPEESLEDYKIKEPETSGFSNSLYTWPTVMTRTHYKEFRILSNDQKNNNKYQNLYLNHTRRPHSHRVELLNQLYNHNLIDYGINSFLNPEKDKDDDGIGYHTYPWYIHINNYDKTIHGEITVSYLNHDCAIELVTETTTNYIRYTEKTWRSIWNRHPFLILGGRGIHKYLHSLGFHLYEEIFDYSFDEEDDEQKRIMGIVKNLKTLKKIKPHKIVRHVQKKILDNYETLYELRKNDVKIPSKFIYDVTKYDKINIFYEQPHLIEAMMKKLKGIKREIEVEIHHEYQMINTNNIHS
jgi:hypothetical protein